MPLRATDFKSAAYAIPPRSQMEGPVGVAPTSEDPQSSALLLSYGSKWRPADESHAARPVLETRRILDREPKYEIPHQVPLVFLLEATHNRLMD